MRRILFQVPVLLLLAVSVLADTAARQDFLAQFQAVDPANVNDARDEIAYLRSLIKPHQPLINNLADEKQLRFTLRNLKKAGRTPASAPQLFAVLLAQRQKHKLAAPAFNAELQDPPPGQRVPVNTITDLGVVASSPNYSTSAISSVPHGTISTLVFVQLFDAATNVPFGTGASNQQFGGGEDVEVTQTSSPPSAINKVGSMFQVIYQANGATDPIILTLEDEADGSPLGPPSVSAPVGTHGNPQIKVCLSRNSGDANCDYGPYQAPTGNPLVQLPVGGSIRFGANVDTTRTIQGSLVVWGRNGGGGCGLTPDPTLFSGAFTPSGRTLNWTFFSIQGGLRVDRAAFGLLNGNPCWTPDQPYGMQLTVDVPIVGEILPEPFFVTTISGPSLGNTTRILPLNFTFGCFAAGTRVLMADGSTKLIEDVKIGDMLIADATGRRLTVRETTKGTEAPPMVIVTDAAGHTVSITEGHAVVVRNGRETKVVLAKELKTGDVVFGSDLPLQNGKPRNFKASKIVKIERRKFDGYVYNVYLGTPGETFDRSNTTLIANGILTGDNAMQVYYGADFHFRPKNVKDRIPREWHRDYDNFLRQQQANNGDVQR